MHFRRAVYFTETLINIISLFAAEIKVPSWSDRNGTVLARANTIRSKLMSTCTAQFDSMQENLMIVALTAIQLQSLLLKRTEGIMGCPTVAAAQLTSCRYSTWCFVAAKTTVSSSSLMTSRSKWSRTASLSSARHDKKLSCNRTRHLQRLPPIGCPGGTGPLCPSPIVSQSRCVSGPLCPVPGPLCPQSHRVSGPLCLIVYQVHCVPAPSCPNPVVYQVRCVLSQAHCAPIPSCLRPIVSHCVPGPLCPRPVVYLVHCVLSQAHCAPIPLCLRPIVSQSLCVSLHTWPTVSQLHYVPGPLSPHPIVSESHCVSVPMCLIVYKAHCVPIPLCLSLIVYKAHCVLVPLCLSPIVLSSRLIVSPSHRVPVLLCTSPTVYQAHLRCVPGPLCPHPIVSHAHCACF